MGYGARPVGAGLGALIAGFYGVEACLLAAVALFAVQALVIVLSPVIRLRQQPDMAGDQICLRSWTKPERVAAASVSS
jgi:hypothetical protein